MGQSSLLQVGASIQISELHLLDKHKTCLYTQCIYVVKCDAHGGPDCRRRSLLLLQIIGGVRAGVGRPPYPPLWRVKLSYRDLVSDHVERFTHEFVCLFALGFQYYNQKVAAVFVNAFGGLFSLPSK